MVALIVAAAVAAWIVCLALVVSLCVVAGRADRRGSPEPLMTAIRLRSGRGQAVAPRLRAR